MKNIREIYKEILGKVGGINLGLGSSPEYKPGVLPFGIDPLDKILGGGLPFGRTILIKGDFSTGKTFLAQKAFQAAQKAGLTCAFVDVERGLSPDWFAITGVDLDNLLVSQPSSGEDAFDIIIALVKAGVRLIVLDSAAGLIPSVELEQSMEQQSVGSLARLLNRGLKRVNAEMANQHIDKSIFILMNQTRMGIGPAPFPTEALPGGKGQWFFSSIVMDLRRGGWIEESVGKEKKRVGFNIRVRTEKNKLAAPFQVCELPFIFEGGVIDATRGLLVLALSLGVIKQRGSFYYFPSFNSEGVNGKLNVLKAMESNPELMDYIRRGVMGEGKNGGLSEVDLNAQ